VVFQGVITAIVATAVMAAESGALRGFLGLLPPPTSLLIFLVGASVVVGPAGLRSKFLLASRRVFAFERILEVNLVTK
jgi:hypothetical protein